MNKKIDMGTFLRYKKQIFYRKKVVIIVFFTLIINNLYGQDSTRNFTSIEKYIEYVYGTYVRKKPNQRVAFVKEIFQKPISYSFNVKYLYDSGYSGRFDEYLCFYEDICNISGYKRQSNFFISEQSSFGIYVKNKNAFSQHLDSINEYLSVNGIKTSSTSSFWDVSKTALVQCKKKYPDRVNLIYIASYFNNSIWNRIIFIEKYATKLDFEISNLFKTDLDTLLGVETPQYLDFYSKLNKNEFKKAKKIWLKAINE